MIKSQNKDIVDLYSQGKPVQKLYSKGELVWERGGVPADFHYTEIYLKISINELVDDAYVGFDFCDAIEGSNCFVDWGDGTEEVVEQGKYLDNIQAKHKYTEIGTYILKILKLRVVTINEMVIFSRLSDKKSSNCLIEILNNTRIGSDVTLFSGCVRGVGKINSQIKQLKIKTFPTDMFKYATNIKCLANFLNESNCDNTDFVEIPNGAFDNMVNLEITQSNFYRCVNLLKSPDALFPINAGGVVNFAGSGLLKIPNKLVTISSRGGVYGEFFANGIYNSSITEIPSNYFERVENNPQVTDLRSTFRSLSNVIKIPPKLLHKMPYLEKINEAFCDMVNLININEDLLDVCVNLSTVAHAFRNCTSLTSIPTNLFHPSKHPNITSFEYCFSGCTEITSEVPPLWEWYPNAKGKKCFYGCTKAANYAEIPDSWK